MLTRDTLTEIVSKISYKDWSFRILEKGDGFLIQAIFLGQDAKTANLEIQKCRKWYVSSYSCAGEVVRTCYKAVEAAELHELQERFKYMGEAIFDPHLDPHCLMLVSKGGDLVRDVRKSEKAL
jgi:hypothetical protein